MNERCDSLSQVMIVSFFLLLLSSFSHLFLSSFFFSDSCFSSFSLSKRVMVIITLTVRKKFSFFLFQTLEKEKKMERGQKRLEREKQKRMKREPHQFIYILKATCSPKILIFFTTFFYLPLFLSPMKG